MLGRLVILQVLGIVGRLWKLGRNIWSQMYGNYT